MAHDDPADDPKPLWSGALERYEARLTSQADILSSRGTTIPNSELLLYDIACRLREANQIAKAGLEWSKSLASLLEKSN